MPGQKCYFCLYIYLARGTQTKRRPQGKTWQLKHKTVSVGNSIGSTLVLDSCFFISQNMELVVHRHKRSTNCQSDSWTKTTAREEYRFHKIMLQIPIAQQERPYGKNLYILTSVLRSFREWNYCSSVPVNLTIKNQPPLPSRPRPVTGRCLPT